MGKYSKTVIINGVALEKALKENKVKFGLISKSVLNKGTGYLRTSVNRGVINKECLEKICIMYNLKAKDFIIEEEPKPQKERTMPVEQALKAIAVSEERVAETTETVDMAMIAKKLDTLIIGIAGLNKAITSLSVKADIDSLNDGVGRVNSTLNIINGRFRDMQDKERGER